MKRQRNTTQMKEQTRNTEIQINEEEIGNLPEKEFRIMRVKMIKNLENKMDKMQESIFKDLEELKNKHTETNNTIIEIKNTLEGINQRRQWHPTPVLLPGKSHGRRSLVGCSPWGHEESDMTEVT